MSAIDAILRSAPVIPILTVDDVADAVPIAAALVAGGLPVIEVTLRTPAALAVIRAMREVPGAVVGAGTVLNPRDLDAALEAGAEFIVSPGLTERLARAALASGVPFLPGAVNASDIMAGLDLGLTHYKYFPAEASGGIAALKTLSGPFAMARFCPTGGITHATAGNWLALDAVICVGGSWVVARSAPDPPAIEIAARAARALAR